MISDLQQLKARYPIAAAWRDLNLPGQPGKSIRSPFREDHSPSFSVHGDSGTRWKDFATGEGGDVFDFVARARGCDAAGAIAWVRERLGLAHASKPMLSNRPQPGAAKCRLPALREGSDEDLRELADRRGFGVEALKLAHRRGFLFFAELWGQAAWCLTDARRELYEFRRVDGEKFDAYGRLPARKCHCVGTGKAWPIGTLESEAFEQVAWVEGAPDFLAALHFLLIEGKERQTAPVGILGAANHRLAPAALAKFKGKRVCLYPHLDEAGRPAAREWARQLKAAGAARVTAFDLSGLVRVDGREGKDLADAALISPDCWERMQKFQEVMP